MEVEFFETKKYSELLPTSLMDEGLCKKIGKEAILCWFFKTPTKRKFAERGDEMEQPIIISSTNKFSEKLNELFFGNLMDKFDFIYDYSFDETYELFFCLNPISPPKYKARSSWWNSNIICMKFMEAEWKIVTNKIWDYNEIFNEDILKFGEVKIKTSS